MKEGRKLVVAFFGGLIKAQEKWLNKKSAEGWRLVKSGIMTYTFERCEPDEYQYAVDYVGSKAFDEAQEYHDFLESLGYKVLYKNINPTYTLLRVRFRPFKKKPWVPVTNLDAYNRELLIVERKTEEGEFRLHTSGEDIKNYYLELIAPYAFLLVLFGGLGIVTMNIFTGAVAALFLIPIIIYLCEINKVKKLEKTEEI
ncbi:MAG: DUF2812 domain-containing protein [Lachnospiraceae bacterium]|nr:DUF2812 domain-containing protein [Lachnospiraceae bacterium]